MKTYLSPAKINLFLHVHRKRPDGFHELSSLFQTIDLYDTLHFAISSQDTLTCSDPSLVVDSSNLVSKAVSLFRAKVNMKFGVTVHLEKKIPQQAGLGGGSSNAATTLWALNQLLGTRFPVDTLTEWATELGSDVPFFLTRGTAFCTGRGEIMREYPTPCLKVPLTIIKPSFGMSTKEVFEILNAEQIPKREPEEDLKRIGQGDPLFYNDLEAPAFVMNPSLKLLKEQLQECGYSAVCMSGTGSAFFCLGASKGELPNEVEVYLSNFVNRPSDCWFGE